MRYQELLENTKQHISLDQAVELISNNQYVQQWIKETDNTPLFRGSRSLKSNNPKIGNMIAGGFNVAPVILTPRTDRKPKDSSRLIQQRYDQAANELGYIKRSEAVFVTPTSQLARTYGYVGVFFPLSAWEVNWSMSIKDFYSLVGTDQVSYLTDDIEQNKDFILNNYFKGELSTATHQNQLGEILVKCDKYILIPKDDYEQIKDKLL